jgi:hypothetical protein
MGQKTLCEISAKTFKRDAEKVKGLVREADHICRRCFRSANNKKYLCKPDKLADS